MVGADDLRGEHLFHGTARVERGPGGGRGGEPFGVLGLGFVGLGADGGGEGAEEVSGEGVVGVDCCGFGGGGRCHGKMSNLKIVRSTGLF